MSLKNENNQLDINILYYVWFNHIIPVSSITVSIKFRQLFKKKKKKLLEKIFRLKIDY